MPPMTVKHVLAGECEKCHKKTVVAKWPYSRPPDFDRALVVEIKCTHCGRIFRLLAALLQVREDSPELHPPSR